MTHDDSYERIDKMWAIKAEEVLPPPYTLHWEFSNGHGWQHSFDEMDGNTLSMKEDRWKHT